MHLNGLGIKFQYDKINYFTILMKLQCGPNAECRHEVFRTGAHTETICVCKDGYTGDADNLEIGCAAHINSFPEDLSHQLGHTSSEINKREGCKVNNETYAVGAEWFDGCEYRCTCDEKKETLCQVYQKNRRFYLSATIKFNSIIK